MKFFPATNWYFKGPLLPLLLSSALLVIFLLRNSGVITPQTVASASVGAASPPLVVVAAPMAEMMPPAVEEVPAPVEVTPVVAPPVEEIALAPVALRPPPAPGPASTPRIRVSRAAVPTVPAEPVEQIVEDGPSDAWHVVSGTVTADEESLGPGRHVEGGAFKASSASVEPGPGEGRIRLKGASGRLGDYGGACWLVLSSGDLVWEECAGGTVIVGGFRVRGENGARFQVTRTSSGTRISVSSGNVVVAGKDQTFFLAAGEHLTIKRDGTVEQPMNTEL